MSFSLNTCLLQYHTCFVLLCLSKLSTETHQSIHRSAVDLKSLQNELSSKNTSLSFTPLHRLGEVKLSCSVVFATPWTCSLPESSVHGILQAIIRAWGVTSFSRGSSQPRDQTQVSCIAGRFFTI